MSDAVVDEVTIVHEVKESLTITFDQQNNDPIFHDKLITGKILPLIMLEKRKEKTLIPYTIYHNITIPLSVKDQLIKYRKISQVNEEYVALITQIDISSEELFDKKHLGVLARLTTIQELVSKEYVNLVIIPEKTVEVHIVKQEKQAGYEKNKEYVFYCEVNILKYEVSNWDTLQQQVQDCFGLVKKIRPHSSFFGTHLLGFDKNLTTEINYLVNTSFLYIELLYIYISTGTIDINYVEFLKTTNLNRRYDQIKESLIKLLTIEYKQHVKEIESKANESITEVREVLKGHIVIIFDKEIEKFLPLSSSASALHKIYMPDHCILTSEQIIQNYYKGDQTVLLIKENSKNYNSNKNIIPSIKAKVTNAIRLESDGFYIYITPESRVRITEIVLKDGVFYGKADEIVELAVSNEEELKQLRILVEQVIVAYSKKPDYDHQWRLYPLYESSKLNIETYAANLSYYLADEVLGYDHNSSSDTNLMQEFCRKTTIEKLQYLLDTINGKNFNKTAATQDNNSSTQEIASTVQQEAVSKETKIDSNDVVNIIKSSNITSSTPTTSEEWIDLGTLQANNKEPEKAIESFNKVLELDPTNEDAIISKAAILIYGSKQYQKAIDIYNQYPHIGKSYAAYIGDAYYALAKYDEAINCYTQIDIDSEKYIHFRYKTGLAYYKLGNYVESVKLLDASLKLDEESANPILNVLNKSILDSLFYDDFTDVQENQLKNIEDVLIINPQSISALVIKMRFLIQLGKYDKALNVNSKLLAFSSDNPALIYYQGVILHKLERSEEALQYIVKAIALNENPRKEWLGDKAAILFHLEKYQEAIVEYDKVLSKEPKNHIILAYKASALVGIKKYDEALKLLEDVLAIDPTYAEAVVRKGTVYFEMGKYQEAIKEYDHAIQLGNNDPKVKLSKEWALEELRKIAEEDNLGYLIENTPLPPSVKTQATVKLNSIKSLNNTDNERNDYKKYLQNLLKLPWGKYDNTNIDLTKARKVLEQEHYGLEEVKSRILEALVFMTRSTHARPPIICLVGSPGVGKTSIANSVAVALERKAITLSLAGANDSNIIRGCMNFYRGATPGKVLSLISEAGTCNPVMVLDEIDKMDSSRGNNLEGALLQLIDPSQNSHFTDDYFNFPFDLSKMRV